MAKLFVTKREITGRLGVSPWLFRRLRQAGTLRPVEMRGYVRGKYYRADEVAKALGVERGWQGA